LPNKGAAKYFLVPKGAMNNKRLKNTGIESRTKIWAYFKLKVLNEVEHKLLMKQKLNARASATVKATRKLVDEINPKINFL